MTETPDDLALMRVADGEADAAERDAVQQAAAADPAIAARLEAFRQSRAAVRAAHPPLPEVPSSLISAIVAADAAMRRAPARPLRARRAVWQAAAAAAVLLVVGGVTGALIGQRAPSTLAALSPDLTAMLEQAPSGAERRIGDALVTITGTHPVPDGSVCREFDVTEAGRRLGGLACREGPTWHLRVAVGRPLPNDGAFRPASGESLVQTMLERLDATAVLDAGAEQALLARGWRR